MGLSGVLLPPQRQQRQQQLLSPATTLPAGSGTPTSTTDTATAAATATTGTTTTLLLALQLRRAPPLPKLLKLIATVLKHHELSVIIVFPMLKITISSATRTAEMIHNICEVPHQRYPALDTTRQELGYLSQLYVPGMKDNGVKRLSQTLNPEP